MHGPTRSRAAAVLAAALVLAPATAFSAPLLEAAGAPPEPIGAMQALEAGAAVQGQLQDYAMALAAQPGLAGKLGLATSQDLPPAEPMSIRDAFAALYATEGVPVPADFAPPAEPLASAMAPVVAAVAQAAVLTQEATASLRAEDRQFLLDHLIPAAMPAPPGSPRSVEDVRVAALVEQVDVAKLQLGAAILARALDEFPQFGWDSPAYQMSWVDPTNMVEVGSTGADVYKTDRVLLIDLGGDDLYANNAGAVGFNWPYKVRVSAVLEVGGDDTYREGPIVEFGTSQGLIRASVTQAAALFGIGLIEDRWGDDDYAAVQNYVNLYNNNGGACYSTVIAQGSAMLGVGALADMGGSDTYWVDVKELINDPQNICHFNYVLAYAQGAGAVNGLGVLAEYTGHDAYRAVTEAAGHYDNMAHTYSQGAGVDASGVLLDQEGDDLYLSRASARFGSNPLVVKGNYAYVFAQGSSLAARSATAIQGCVPLLEDLVPLPAHPPCPTPALGLLVDILGDDYFSAEPYATDNGYGCNVAIWAVSSSQGSGVWFGLGALVNLDASGSDYFSMTPSANSVNCPGLGVRAMSYGQGYGGPILWNIFDTPLPFNGLLGQEAPSSLDLGVLVSGGLQDKGDCPTPRFTLFSTPYVQQCEDLFDYPMPHFGSANDVYVSSALASNRPANGYPVFAESWVQGSAGNAPALGNGLSAVGIGLAVDAGGDDTYIGHAYALGYQPKALSVAQGATVGSIAIHLDLGGRDLYSARAFENGVDNPVRTLAQGLAAGNNLLTATTPGFCVPGSVCVSSLTVTVLSMQGIHIDVGGWDYYSEYYDPGSGLCPRDGITGAMQRWGTSPGGCLTTVPASTGFALGIDWMSEI